VHIINNVSLVGNIPLLIVLGLAGAGSGYLAYDALHGAAPDSKLKWLPLG
jgi:hypothetical protein